MGYRETVTPWGTTTAPLKLYPDAAYQSPVCGYTVGNNHGSIEVLVTHRSMARSSNTVVANHGSIEGRLSWEGSGYSRRNPVASKGRNNSEGGDKWK